MALVLRILSSEKHTHEVLFSVAFPLSGLVRTLVSESPFPDSLDIDLPLVTSCTIAIVIEYMMYYVNDNMNLIEKASFIISC